MAVLDRQRPHQSVPVEAAQYWLIAGGLLVILFASIQVMPVQIHMQSGVNHRLQWRTEQRDKSFESSATIRTEQFSWELIQQLKPGVQSVPASIETIEQVVIHVPKPDKQELRSNDIVFGGDKAPVMIPSIDIQGFIPLNMATPEYPHQALVKGIEGWVEVVYSIDVDGNIVDPKITAHQPSRIFDRSVLAALKKSHYRPQLLDGQPVIVQGVTEVFRFNLVSHSALDNENQNLVDRDALDRRRR